MIGRFDVLPGRLGVLVAGDEEVGMVVIPEWLRRKSEALYGVVPRGRRGKVVASGVPDLHPGETVVVREDAAALVLETRDYPFVPAGHELRIYGVHEPVTDAVAWREVPDAVAAV